MIEPIRKKLGIIFFSIMLVVNLFSLATIYAVLHIKLAENAKEHIQQIIATEFLPHYQTNDFETLNKIIEDEHIQLLDPKGAVLIDVKTSIHFKGPANAGHLAAALAGKTVYEIQKYENERYMVAYEAADKDHVIKVTMALEELYDFEKDFRLLLLLLIPFMFILSYFLSRYMVRQSLGPIMDVMTYQETFSSNVTHELHSPLTSIKGNIEVALRRERPAEEYRDTLKLTLKKINEISRLLKNLALLAKSKFKDLDLLKEEVDLKKMIDELVDQYEPYIFAHNLQLDIDIKPNISCMCDKSFLRRVIENLLENAIKYTPNNGKISMQSLLGERSLSFSISNTCRNISKNDLKNLFHPFYRGEKESDTGEEGTALGLYIVKYIVQSHRGKIDAALEGETLTFTVKIPTE